MLKKLSNTATGNSGVTSCWLWKRTKPSSSRWTRFGRGVEKRGMNKTIHNKRETHTKIHNSYLSFQQPPHFWQSENRANTRRCTQKRYMPDTHTHTHTNWCCTDGKKYSQTHSWPFLTAVSKQQRHVLKGGRVNVSDASSERRTYTTAHFWCRSGAKLKRKICTEGWLKTMWVVEGGTRFTESELNEWTAFRLVHLSQHETSLETRKS